jgi:hypothetical protein
MENYSCVQIKTKLVDFVEISGETAEILSQSALQTIRKLGLENKVIAISGDNTGTSFGGLKQKGTNNVFCKIKEDLNRGVIGLECVAHMIHSCAHSSVNTVPLDIEGLIVKIFGYFHIFTVRVERLKEFCNFVGQQYKDILGYSNVRWLSLLPAVRIICELYSTLQSFFMSEEKCPVMLKKWVCDPCSQLWLNFVNSTLPLFHDAIRKAEAHCC